MPSGILTWGHPPMEIFMPLSRFYLILFFVVLAPQLYPWGAVVLAVLFFVAAQWFSLKELREARKEKGE